MIWHRCRLYVIVAGGVAVAGLFAAGFAIPPDLQDGGASQTTVATCAQLLAGMLALLVAVWGVGFQLAVSMDMGVLLRDALKQPRILMPLCCTGVPMLASLYALHHGSNGGLGFASFCGVLFALAVLVLGAPGIADAFSPDRLLEGYATSISKRLAGAKHRMPARRLEGWIPEEMQAEAIADLRPIAEVLRSAIQRDRYSVADASLEALAIVHRRYLRLKPLETSDDTVLRFLVFQLRQSWQAALLARNAGIADLLAQRCGRMGADAAELANLGVFGFSGIWASQWAHVNLDLAVASLDERSSAALGIAVHELGSVCRSLVLRGTPGGIDKVVFDIVPSYMQLLPLLAGRAQNEWGEMRSWECVSMVLRCVIWMLSEEANREFLIAPKASYVIGKLRSSLDGTFEVFARRGSMYLHFGFTGPMLNVQDGNRNPLQEAILAVSQWERGPREECLDTLDDLVSLYSGVVEQFVVQGAHAAEELACCVAEALATCLEWRARVSDHARLEERLDKLALHLALAGSRPSVAASPEEEYRTGPVRFVVPALLLAYHSEHRWLVCLDAFHSVLDSILGRAVELRNQAQTSRRHHQESVVSVARELAAWYYCTVGADTWLQGVGARLRQFPVLPRGQCGDDYEDMPDVYYRHSDFDLTRLPRSGYWPRNDLVQWVGETVIGRVDRVAFNDWLTGPRSPTTAHRHTTASHSADAPGSPASCRRQGAQQDRNTD